MLALMNNSAPTSFTLTSNGNVNFLVGDSVHLDNLGGISLSIAPIPIPPAIWLFSTSLIGLFGLRKKSKISAPSA
jgi:hypothetical protein